MTEASWVWACAVAAVVCALTLAGLLRVRDALPLDQPNARSLHSTPTPRIGGLGIAAGIAAGVAVGLGMAGVQAGIQTDMAVSWRALAGAPGTVLAGALVLGAVSFVDDARGLSARLRLVVQAGVAATVLVALGFGGTGFGGAGFGGAGYPGWALVALTLALVWMSNLYNFMDGADGLAGAMALIGFATLALAAGDAGAWPLATTAAAVAAAAAAFLFFNAPPARLFMGDAGSVPLGFMAAALGAVGTRDGVWPGWFMPLVFAPFILDASVTLLRRALRGERLAQAHREHYYQRAALLGVSRRALFGASVAIMGVTAALALGVRAGLDSAGLGLAVWGSVVMLGMGWIDARWRQRDGGAR